jgi:hypothetical protein
MGTKVKKLAVVGIQSENSIDRLEICLSFSFFWLAGGEKKGYFATAILRTKVGSPSATISLGMQYFQCSQFLKISHMHLTFCLFEISASVVGSAIAFHTHSPIPVQKIGS